MNTLWDNLASRIAWALPRRIVYHAGFRLWLHACRNDQSVRASKMTVDEAIKLWNDLGLERITDNG